MTLIYYWPDGFWCYPEELESCQVGRSDDYGELELPEDRDIESSVYMAINFNDE